MQSNDQDQRDYTCGDCGESLAEKGRLLADQFLCDDCYIDKISSRKAHRTYYSHDPFGYFRRLKGNEPIHPQKLH